MAVNFIDSPFASVQESQRVLLSGSGRVYDLFDNGWLERLKIGGRTVTTRESLDVVVAAIKAGIDVTKPKPADLVIERQPDGGYTFSRRKQQRRTAPLRDRSQ